MKKVIAGILLVASVGYAAPIVNVHIPTQRVKAEAPRKINLDGQWYHNPSWGQQMQAGWRKFDQATIPTLSNDYARASVVYVQSTNDADFAVMEVVDEFLDNAADAELSQELLGNFISAVTNTWEDVTFTGSRKQIRQLTRRLVTETKAQALILDDETKTITERLAATSELRKLDTLAGYAAQLGIGQKKGQ